ncbi:MAG: Ldh family oxidoreductase [Casimicrobiaceae bacterium]
MIDEAGGRVRLAATEARELALRALRGGGCGDEEAAALAEHMLDAALCGYEYSGLPKVLNVVEYRRAHPVSGPLALRRETPMSSLFDGGGLNAMYTVMRAAENAIAKARATGFALVGVNNTWMSGRSAHYVEMIARAGLIGIHAVSARHLVAPPGAQGRAMGTNPIAFGFPTEGDPLLVDVGMSSLMYTDLALRVRRGEPLAEGLALDAGGEPTQDPAAAQRGALLFFGGHKGFALALAMQALGILAGSAEDPDSAGYVIMAMQPDLLVPLAEYRRALAESLAQVKAAPRLRGVDEIRLPSERSHAERRRNLRDGIVIDRSIHERLRALASAQ